jgi:hypothetical protein
VLCPQSSQEKKLKEKEKINFFSKMRECDIVVGTLLFFSQKKYLAINGQKTQHLKREKKEPEKKLILPMENFPQKSKTTTHKKKE